MMQKRGILEIKIEMGDFWKGNRKIVMCRGGGGVHRRGLMERSRWRRGKVAELKKKRG